MFASFEKKHHFFCRARDMCHMIVSRFDHKNAENLPNLNKHVYLMNMLVKCVC